MSRLRVAVILLSVLCCNVNSQDGDVLTFSKKLEVNINQLRMGSNPVDKTSLVYTECTSDPDRTLAKCRVKYFTDVFDESKIKYTCTLKFESKQKDIKVDILDIIPWGLDKVVLKWQKIVDSEAASSDVTIEMVRLRVCESNYYTLQVDHDDKMKPELHIIPTRHKLEVAFMDKTKCGSSFCRVTISEDAEYIELGRWFPKTASVHALESIGDNTNRLLLTEDKGIMKFYIMNEKGTNLLGVYNDARYLGWSTSNELISFCTHDTCIEFDHQGKDKKGRMLQLRRRPTEYAALYNVASLENLALICDSKSENYRISRIGYDGQEIFSYKVKSLSCSNKPLVMKAKFFRRSDTEHCLSVFYSLEGDEGFMFETYCV